MTRAPALTLAVTVVGHAPSAGATSSRAPAPSPATPWSLTGELGGAAAGLLLLERPELARRCSTRQTAERAARGASSSPTPRLAAGRALAAAGATAMIDLSDGLGGDAGHLAAASGVGLRIDADALPLAAGVAEVAAAAGRDPLELAARGGEDYELLAALPPERLDEATARSREAEETTLTQIGEVVAGERGRDQAARRRDCWSRRDSTSSR